MRARRILLLEADIEGILKKTSMHVAEFADAVRGYEPYNFQMRKTSEGKCLFLKNSECVIYDARPLICRFYPFELASARDKKHVFKYTIECPGIGTGPRLNKSHFQKLFAHAEMLTRNATRTDDDS